MVNGERRAVMRRKGDDATAVPTMLIVSILVVFGITVSWQFVAWVDGRPAPSSAPVQAAPIHVVIDEKPAFHPLDNTLRRY